MLLGAGTRCLRRARGRGREGRRAARRTSAGDLPNDAVAALSCAALRVAALCLPRRPPCPALVCPLYRAGFALSEGLCPSGPSQRSRRTKLTTPRPIGPQPTAAKPYLPCRTTRPLAWARPTLLPNMGSQRVPTGRQAGKETCTAPPCSTHVYDGRSAGDPSPQRRGRSAQRRRQVRQRRLRGQQQLVQVVEDAVGASGADAVRLQQGQGGGRGVGLRFDVPPP